MPVGTKVTVIDENSGLEGIEGIVVANRDGFVRIQQIGLNRYGVPIDCSWHLQASQLRAV